MTDGSLRVLLVDGQDEDARWIQELLCELEEGRYGGGWISGFEVLPLERLSEAIAVLADSTSPATDVILLNPALPDSYGLHGLLKLQRVVPEIPIVILSDNDDRDLALSLLRAGAQDVLVKDQVECLPLAKSLRLAVERGKQLRELRAGTWRDELTGLPNRFAFETLVTHNLQLAVRIKQPVWLAAIEIRGLDVMADLYGRQERQLAILDACELLQTSVIAPDTIGRIGEQLFGICFPSTSEVEVRRLLYVVQKRLRKLHQTKANRGGLELRTGLASQHPGERNHAALLIEEAEQGLCENVGGISLEFLNKEGHPTVAATFAHRAGRHL